MSQDVSELSGPEGLSLFPDAKKRALYWAVMMAKKGQLDCFLDLAPAYRHLEPASFERALSELGMWLPALWEDHKASKKEIQLVITWLLDPELDKKALAEQEIPHQFEVGRGDDYYEVLWRDRLSVRNGKSASIVKLAEQAEAEVVCEKLAECLADARGLFVWTGKGWQHHSFYHEPYLRWAWTPGMYWSQGAVDGYRSYDSMGSLNCFPKESRAVLDSVPLFSGRVRVRLLGTKSWCFAIEGSEVVALEEGYKDYQFNWMANIFLQLAVGRTEGSFGGGSWKVMST